jgi:diadenylate cyclase
VISAFLQVNWLDTLLSGSGKLFFQFTILAVIFYFIYNKFIRQSNADKLVKGLFVVLIALVALWALSQQFQLAILEIVFRTSVELLIFGLIVIFQPELRRVLFFFGQNPLLFFQGSEQTQNPVWVYSDPKQVVKSLSDAIRFLSKSKTGALIVLDCDEESRVEEHILEAGTPINALLSAPLLMTIFHPNTPLHDGAVIIGRDHTIASAGVLLPLTEDPNLSWRYGTRHRAAIGLTELCNGVCIVISEETGNISYVQQGAIIKLPTNAELIKRLEALYTVDAEELTDDNESGSLFASPINQLMRVMRTLQGKRLPFWKRW